MFSFAAPGLFLSLLPSKGRGSPERVTGNPTSTGCPTATADQNKGLANEGRGNVPVTVAKKDD